MKQLQIFFTLLILSIFAYAKSSHAASDQAVFLNIDLTIPQISTTQYQRPFVAIWLEKKGERRADTNFAVWFDDKKWLKDIRRWWRKSGRYNQDIDSFTGATKPPGEYKLNFSLPKELVQSGGQYTLFIEAVREHGNRTLLKQPIDLSLKLPQSYELKAGKEIGPVIIRIGE